MTAPKNTPEDQVSKEKVIEDLKTAARNAEELVKNAADEMGEKTRARLKETIERAKETAHKLEDKAIAGAKITDEAIRAHPYESLGIAFGVGVLIGVLIGRK
jgi:ElaB/YqjD/DUF883 family membrane-anchored ribosome-binding protein